MTVKNIFDQISQLQLAVKELIQTDGNPILLQILEPYFAVSEQIESVSWTQYTPYFNDGDPCVFTVNFEGCVKIAGTANDIGDYEDGVVSPWYLNYCLSKGTLGDLGLDLTHWTDVRIQLMQVIASQIGDYFYKSPYSTSTNAESGKYQILLQQLFGDHVKVTVKRTGEIEVDYYEHD